jgi:cystathionine gamma-synthase
MTSTFRSGNEDGFDYTRSGNPNFRLVEESVASLEGANYATCFASGVSAITAVVSSLKAGDLVLAEENVYGCTYRLLERVFAKFGLKTRYTDLSLEKNWSAITELKPASFGLRAPRTRS